MKKSEVCSLHEHLQTALDENTKLAAATNNDTAWIKEHIRQATENKKWVIGAIGSGIAILISLFK